VAKLVRYFVFEAPSSDAAWTEKQTLAKLGEEAYPAALEILRDPSLREKLVVLTKREHSLPEAPINRLCQIFDLRTPPPPEAVELLAPFLESDSREIKESAALIIGSVGSEASLPYLRRALTAENEGVRTYALYGIGRAISGGRIDQALRGSYFDMLAAIWPEDTAYEVSRSVPLFLLQLDRDRAVERLLSPELFTTEFKSVYRILEAFARESVEVPRPRLLPLIEQAGKEPIGYPMDYVLEEALAFLGKYRMQEDLPTLERFVDHANEQVARGAIDGLYTYHRHHEVVRDPWELWENAGWDALTEVEKHICAITELDSEVANGGFAQYYFNSSGDHWRDALRGLSAIGAEKHRRIMAATVRKFGDAPPSSKRDTRTSQLSKLVRKKEDPFDEQDSAWFKAGSLDALIFRYNLANTEGRRKAGRSGVQ
jgi:hypothetical protein